MNNDESPNDIPDLPVGELTQYLEQLKTIMLQMQQSEKELSPEEAAKYMAAMEKIKEQFGQAKQQVFFRVRDNLLAMDKEQRINHLRGLETPLIHKLSSSSLISEDYEICEAIKLVLLERGEG